MLRRELRRKVMGVRVLPQHLTITGALALSLSLLALLVAGSQQANALEDGYEPDQVIVKLNPLLNTHIDEINADYGTKTRDASLASRRVYLLDLPENSDEQTFAQKLFEDPERRVLYAEPNFVAEAPESTVADGRMRARVTNDPRRSDSSDRYAITNLNLSSCGLDTDRGEGITVAVLDTGAQLDHPKLEANFEGVKLRDFVDDDANPTDELDKDPRDGKRDRMAGHGTHVAGIVDRIAPGARIMPLRVLNTRGSGDVFTIAKAISYAQRHEADVMNLSFGSSERSHLLQEMIGHAIDKGVVVAAAAGNTDDNTPHYPAAGNFGIDLDDPVLPPPPSARGLLGVTSVASYDSDDARNELKSWFSTYGLWVDISAPGEEIRSAFPGDKVAVWSGTSMATPFVSGQAALVRADNGRLGSAEIAKRIRRSAGEDSLAFYTRNASYPRMLGAGHADVCGSLEE
jgi:subtilisin family serine protease